MLYPLWEIKGNPRLLGFKVHVLGVWNTGVAGLKLKGQPSTRQDDIMSFHCQVAGPVLVA